MKARRSAGAVYALFLDPDAVQRAVDGLCAAGVSASEIVVMSSEPYEEYGSAIATRQRGCTGSRRPAALWVRERPRRCW